MLCADFAIFISGIERAMCRLSCWGSWVNDFTGLVLLFYAHYVFDKMLQATHNNRPKREGRLHCGGTDFKRLEVP
ncbi:hypothetical protein P8452_52210 [Trifolium repens]|nr:hypothetical protein P8452_52210 [Trifolium repens]